MIKFLFFDLQEVECARGFTRRLNRPTKHGQNPIFLPDAPWESRNMTLYGSAIVLDDGMFKLWYTTTHVDGGSYLAYAESDDGISWRRPLLDIYPYEGQKTNLVFAKPHGASVIFDEDEPREAWKYKMLTGAPPSGCIYAYYSHDGIHWQRVGAGPVIGTRPDCPMGFHRVDGRYVVYHRVWGHGRRIFRSESWDFRHWSEPRMVLEPDASDEAQVEFYGLGVRAYGPYEIGTLWIYHTDEDDFGIHKMNGYEDAEFAYTRFGYAWHRAAQNEPFITSGDADAWDCGNIQCASAPLYLPNEIRYYYAGTNVRHKPGWEREKQTSGLGVAAQRPDGFISMEAGSVPGEIITRAFKLPSTDVWLNAVTGTEGWVEVGLLDQGGTPIKGFDRPVRFIGDETAHRVQWMHDEGSASPSGQLARLRIRAQNAEVFSVAVGERDAYFRFTEGNPARNHIGV